MNDPAFPRQVDAPGSLQLLEGNCGALSVWQVLKYFGQDASTQEVLSACRFDAVQGVYAIGIAVALAEFGLRVSFFSDPDTDRNPQEQDLYARASALGVSLEPGVTLFELERAIERAPSDSGIGIILYEGALGEAHFTPFLGLLDDEIVAPNEGDGLLIADVETRRSASGILRQAVAAHAPDHGVQTT